MSSNMLTTAATPILCADTFLQCTFNIHHGHILAQMPPPKTVAAAAIASKASFINVPRVSWPCSYREFLKTLLSEKHNRKVFLSSGKEAVDQCFRLQATQQFKLANDKLKRAMAEVNIDLDIVRPR
jgi:hypothetical protein